MTKADSANGYTRNDISSIYFDVIKPKPYLPKPLRLMLSVTENKNYNSYGMITLEPCYDFHYTISGEGELIYNGKVWRVKPKDGFIWFKDDAKISYRYPKNAKKPWKFISFCFMQDNLLNTIDNLIDENNPLFPLSDDEPIIKRLIKTASSDGRITLTCAEGADMVYSLLVALMKKSSSNEAKEFHPIINKIKRVISSKLYSGINVSELADELGVTREYISRIFKEYTGEKLKEYIIKARIELACDYIASTEMSIREISEKLNYSSPSNFSRDFSAVMGISPYEYRRSKSFNLLF